MKAANWGITRRFPAGDDSLGCAGSLRGAHPAKHRSQPGPPVENEKVIKIQDWNGTDDKKLKKAIEHDMKILMKQSKSERLFGSEDEVEIVRQHLDDCELVE